MKVWLRLDFMLNRHITDTKAKQKLGKVEVGQQLNAAGIKSK